MNKLGKAAMLVATFAAAAPALADPPPWAPAHGRRAHEARAHQARIYDSGGRYVEPHAISRGDSVWRGNDGRYYCKRDNGTTGLVIGAALGALAGREIDGGRNRTLGTVLGAAGGGLLGREIDRGSLKCR